MNIPAVSYESGSKGFLVERKSAADFRASIVDGRFAEKRSRLLQSGFVFTSSRGTCG